MSLTAGERVGPYEIISLIGAGGMGEVYKARDTRLDRTVAIKKSLGRFSERFEREARAIAALNHPHICSLYDVGPDFLVMEFVEGRPLSGPMPIEQALAVGRQILDALDAAHRKGIVHRDLKPANILLTKSGVKLLDFGLAKATEHVGPEMVTVGDPLTGAGAIVGTLHYMAPEQIEGREVDTRTDIFAFGLILHELITGKRVFEGASAASVMAAILKDPAPPISSLQPLTLKSFDRVVQTCLEKDPDDRWQSAREVKHALDWMSATDAPAQPTRGAASTGSLRLWQGIAAAAAVVAAIAISVTLRPQRAGSLDPMRFEVFPSPGNVFSQYLVVSPDGRRLAYRAVGADGIARWWVRDLQNLQARVLTGTEGASGAFWSPDSKTLAFGLDARLMKIDVAGGPAQMITEVMSTVGSGTWLENGTILFGSRGGGSLQRVAQGGGQATPLTSADGNASSFPSALPDGRHFLYYRAGPISGIFVGDLSAKPQEQPTEPLLRTPHGGAFVATASGGRLLFLSDGSLMAQPFDASAMKLSGDAVLIASGVANFDPYAAFSASATGSTLVFLAREAATERQLTWFDRQGKTGAKVGDPGVHEQIALSPDERSLIEHDASGLAGDLRVLELRSGLPSPLTFDRALRGGSVWSPESNTIAYSKVHDGRWGLWSKPANGAGAEDRLLEIGDVGGRPAPSSWSRDGTFLLFHYLSGGGGLDMFKLPLDTRKPEVLLRTKASERFASLSPDDRWVAYISNETRGRDEVFVRPMATGKGAASGGRWQVSKDGAVEGPIAWKADGTELVFRDMTSTLISVPVEVSGDVLKPGRPQQLFEVSVGTPWTMSKDGKRFLVAMPQGVTKQPPITVVLNWDSLFTK